MFLFSSATVGIFGAIIALVLIALIIIKRYRIAKPDEAIIVTGGKGKIKIAMSVNSGVTMTNNNQYKIDRNHTMKQTPVGNRAEYKTTSSHNVAHITARLHGLRFAPC